MAARRPAPRPRTTQSCAQRERRASLRIAPAFASAYALGASTFALMRFGGLKPSDLPSPAEAILR